MAPLRAPPHAPAIAQAIPAEVPTRLAATPSRDRLVRETWRTWPNAVTGLRVVAALGCFVVSALRQDEVWSWAGLAIYWALDVADGALARALRQETRIGAQLDILSDRLLLGAFYATFLRSHPAMVVPVALHLAQFVVLDQYLSQQFLRWPCLSPNYFHEVDRIIWEWNWSAPAKVANGALATTAIVVAAAAGWSWIVPAAVCAPVIALKIWSIARLASLPPPEPWIRRAGGGR
jgi:CDP-diacylglycerol---glycerol-3-phosphate 3-phosphatidyltransferase